MKNKKIFSVIVSTALLIFLFIGCSKEKVDVGKYIGRELKIAVLGEIPKIKEEKIKFEKVGFEDIENISSSEKYDAIFVMNENLNEASKDKYKDIYLNSKATFFFIDSEKGRIPFMIKGVSYEEEEKIETFPYIVSLEENASSIGFGLYNDDKTEENIQACYNRVFGYISELK